MVTPDAVSFKQLLKVKNLIVTMSLSRLPGLNIRCQELPHRLQAANTPTVDAFSVVFMGRGLELVADCGNCRW
jgi:hypothetical protein